MIIVTSFDPTLLYITLKWNAVTLNLSEFMKPGKVMMKSSSAIFLLISYLSICQDTCSTPIVPLSLNFKKVVRPFLIKVDSSDASIGPGLGGSPILVDTSQHKVYDDEYSTANLPWRSLARSGLKDTIQLSTPEELALDQSSSFSSKRHIERLLEICGTTFGMIHLKRLR